MVNAFSVYARKPGQLVMCQAKLLHIVHRIGLEVPCTYRIKGPKAPVEKGKICSWEYLERKNA